jgi:hypothetical protein
MKILHLKLDFHGFARSLVRATLPQNEIFDNATATELPESQA